MGIELSPRTNDHGFQKKRDSSCSASLDAFCRVPPLYSFAQITTGKWMRSTSRKGGMAMKFVLFLASERACRVNVQWSGSTAIRAIRVRASSTDTQHWRTYRFNCPIFWCTSRLNFGALTHRMVMENRPVDPGIIQGRHRPISLPISFIRIKHGTRADDILCKTEY